jgi:hypothetical protein
VLKVDMDGGDIFNSFITLLINLVAIFNPPKYFKYFYIIVVMKEEKDVIGKSERIGLGIGYLKWIWMDG